MKVHKKVIDDIQMNRFHVLIDYFYLWERLIKTADKHLIIYITIGMIIYDSF